MAILKIARMGHPVLLKRAEDVADVSAPDVGRLIQDMMETLADAGGVGLAAATSLCFKKAFPVFRAGKPERGRGRSAMRCAGSH
ncbi:Peptide deformylase [Acetobacter malorum]|uniref:Peptide deformylase n=1 Tax=Acetobacter malorum TaxID=178901 RepID=A0A177GD86_9PROT|nr:Peptide deformylase [Acetobacter malorum]